MYAILHLPTGFFLSYKKAPNTVLVHLTPAFAIEECKYMFYSKTEDEKYKRSFLVALYSMRSSSFSGSRFVFPKQRPKFLRKRNKKNTYHMQEHAILVGLSSLQYYPIITDPTTGIIKVSSANEFLVVKI